MFHFLQCIGQHEGKNVLQWRFCKTSEKITFECEENFDTANQISDGQKSGRVKKSGGAT